MTRGFFSHKSSLHRIHGLRDNKHYYFDRLDSYQQTINQFLVGTLSLFSFTKMASAELPVELETNATTDVGTIWKTAIDRYEEVTAVKIQSLAVVNNVDDILAEISERDMKLKGHRHDSSKSDKFRTLVSKSLSPIEKLSNIGASVAAAVRNLASAHWLVGDNLCFYHDSLSLLALLSSQPSATLSKYDTCITTQV